MFKYDLHVHTSEVSNCGNVSAKDLVGLYKDSGYDGVVITDHFHEGYFLDRFQLGWEESCKQFFSGYEIAKEEGLKVGLNVLRGFELTLEENWNHYLVFGMPMDFIVKNEFFTRWDLKQFKENTKELGILIIQAHPFRPNHIPMDPKLLDGIEGFNGNKRHYSDNQTAQKYASVNGLFTTSGSDFHEIEDLGGGGIMTQEPISNMQQLISILQNGNYKLIESL